MTNGVDPVDLPGRQALHAVETLWHQRAMDRMSELEESLRSYKRVVNNLKGTVAEFESMVEQLTARLDNASSSFTKMKKRLDALEKNDEA